MRKYTRKSTWGGLIARPSALTTQIEADLAPSLSHVLHGHFAHWRRCERILPLVIALPLKGYKKMLAFPAVLRLTSEQIATCHFDLSL